jgi:hypothetical protein
MNNKKEKRKKWERLKIKINKFIGKIQTIQLRTLDSHPDIKEALKENHIIMRTNMNNIIEEIIEVKMIEKITIDNLREEIIIILIDKVKKKTIENLT